eukprot:TRINITY_DN16077_c0_g1_i3.p1 TRINITY_DN16077_c0_g1~~TRINITY_DN16077_c0_g1_i3.p1  ORF type:complete len:212 (+),score=40.03 TRINITY_DN16077_c0_g1_i3:68-637(+)
MEGKVFFGYHATSAAAARSMVASGFDPSKLGTGAGQVRGPGFYAAAVRNGAKEWADKDDALKQELGGDGHTVVKVYVPAGLQCHFGTSNVGDCAWGVFGNLGNPNGDNLIQKTDHIQDLEIVIREAAARQITFVMDDDRTEREIVQWPAYPSLPEETALHLLPLPTSLSRRAQMRTGSIRMACCIHRTL